MIEERVQVMAVAEDSVLLAARRKSACGDCAARAGCGHGLLDDIGRTRAVALTLPRGQLPAEVSAGQSVLLGVPAGTVLAASIRVYLIPLLGLLGGALLAQGVMPGHDAAALLAALSGLALAVLAAGHRQRGIDRRLRIRCRTLPASAAEPAGGSTV